MDERAEMEVFYSSEKRDLGSTTYNNGYIKNSTQKLPTVTVNAFGKTVNKNSAKSSGNQQKFATFGGRVRLAPNKAFGVDDQDKDLYGSLYVNRLDKRKSKSTSDLTVSEGRIGSV